MFAILFVTHGTLGESLVKTAEFIMAKDLSERTEIFTIDYSMLSDMDNIRDAIEKSSERWLGKGYKVLLFVDIFGGSPSNVAFTLSKRESLDIVSGVNLPMTINAFENMDSDMEISELVAGIVQSGNDSIISAKNLLINRDRN